MKLELNQAEIEMALIEYVGSQGISISDKSITVDMVAGRGVNGFTAHITIERTPANTDNGADATAPSFPKIEDAPNASGDIAEPSDKTELFVKP